MGRTAECTEYPLRAVRLMLKSHSLFHFPRLLPARGSQHKTRVHTIILSRNSCTLGWVSYCREQPQSVSKTPHCSTTSPSVFPVSLRLRTTGPSRSVSDIRVRARASLTGAQSSPPSSHLAPPRRLPSSLPHHYHLHPHLSFSAWPSSPSSPSVSSSSSWWGSSRYLRSLTSLPDPPHSLTARHCSPGEDKGHSEGARCPRIPEDWGSKAC